MINLDALTLKLFYEENRDYFINGKIQKIQQPSRNELIFTIRNNAISKKFYINFNPNFYHLCFMNNESEKRRNLSIPKTAPMFCMLLRKYIQNAKIINVEVPKYERIFEIYFEYFDELNEKSQLCLAIELMGKYSNVILYNYDTNVIIGCAHNVSAEKSRERELYGSLPYIYPPKQKKKNIERISLDSFIANIESEKISQSIASTYNYLTISTVEDFINSISPFSFEDLYLNLQNYVTQKEYPKYISNNFNKFLLYHQNNSFTVDNVNTMIDEYFSYHQAKSIKSNLESKIIKYINTQLNKLYNLKEKQEIQIEKLDKALDFKNKADIIMANIYLLNNLVSNSTTASETQKKCSNNKNFQLYDFEGKEIQIDLDENLTPTENANRYYALYRKTKTAYEHSLEMIKETNSQILFFEEQKFYTQNALNFNELNDIYFELFEENNLKEEKTTIVEFVEINGFKIYIGKNKKQNDYILSKISHAEDLWFHPLNSAGAHILVKTKNAKEDIPDEVLLKAAQLTKEYSSCKNNSKTSIIYTKRKYVKKANNKLAFVTYKNETEIVI